MKYFFICSKTLVSVLKPKFRSGVHLQKSGLILVWQLFLCLSIVQ